jgi:hypothetical protein
MFHFVCRILQLLAATFSCTSCFMITMLSNSVAIISSRLGSGLRHYQVSCPLELTSLLVYRKVIGCHVRSSVGLHHEVRWSFNPLGG